MLSGFPLNALHIRCSNARDATALIAKAVGRDIPSFRRTSNTFCALLKKEGNLMLGWDNAQK
jgi:hypothetical protein